MGKVVGYAIAIIGLLTIIIGVSSKSLPLQFLSGFSPASVMMAGVVLVVAGVVFALMKSKPTEAQAQKEVPIYTGDKIVGYRRESA